MKPHFMLPFEAILGSLAPLIRAEKGFRVADM
jgi:hypothetical protein